MRTAAREATERVLAVATAKFRQPSEPSFSPIGAPRGSSTDGQVADGPSESNKAARSNLESQFFDADGSVPFERVEAVSHVEFSFALPTAGTNDLQVAETDGGASAPFDLTWSAGQQDATAPKGIDGRAFSDDRRSPGMP